MVYIHVPFCESFCVYCGFYSEICAPGARGWEAYTDAAISEIRLKREQIRLSVAQGVNTIYIGGGTPSVLPPAALRRIVEAVREIVSDEGPIAEFTLEVNPEDIVRRGPSFAAELRSMGVNRISMGVQSFDDKVLGWMRRRHSAQGAKEAFRILRQAGFDNISIDLIFGINLESISDRPADLIWRESIEEALALDPEHISAYQLSIDPQSALASMVEKERYSLLDEESCRRQYEILCETLEKAGYEHYEISSFAKKGRRAVHNSAYWTHLPYVGIGPAAHGFVQGRRSWNASDIKLWLKGEGSGYETPDKEQLDMETLMLGLRTSDGLLESFLERVCEPASLREELASAHLEKSLISGNLRIPEKDFFISDNIIEKLI